MSKVAFMTLGCKVNQFETETLEGLFTARGYEIVGFHEIADIYVINTCSVTHLGERKSRQQIHRAARLNPNACIAVTGCYAQIASGEVASIPGVDVVIGTQHREKIVDLVEAAIEKRQKINAVENIMQAASFEEIPLLAMPGRTRAFLKIQEGCTNFCTYCIIPYARGPLRSRPLTGIIEEVRKLAAAGFQEVVLTGIHLGSYGRDVSETVQLTDVVKAISEITGISRIRLSSLESVEMTDEMLTLLKTNPKLCHHLHLPLQSGSDTILKAMKRPYTTGEYRALVNHILQEVPDLALSTDLIVGFPGETAELFHETVRFVQEIPFAKMHIFPYSKREGTPAASYSGQLTEDVKKQRLHVIEKIAAEHAEAYAKRFIGKTLPVLFETETDGIAEGHTENYLKVYAPASAEAVGTLTPVHIQSLWRDGLKGVQ